MSPKIEKKVINNMDVVLPDNTNILYHGVWDFSDTKAYVSSYGASYIKIRFKGTGCTVLYDAPGCDFQYSVDDGGFIILPADNKGEHVLACGLADTIHTLMFTRRSHCTAGDAIFKGFKAPAGCTFEIVQPGPDAKIKIEFIGDSITAGCLNEFPGIFHNNSVTPLLENAHMAYGPQAARLLNADWSCIAVGGAGLYHNWQEIKPGTQNHLQDYFVSTRFKPINKNRMFTGPAPDCVVVAAGTNDFGSDPVPEKTHYREIYAAFIRLIRSKYPEASVFCVGPWAFTKGGHTSFDDCRKEIKKAVSNLNDRSVYYIDPVNGSGGPWLDKAEDFAGDWIHPVTMGHAKIAEKLSAIIKKRAFERSA